MNTLKHDAEKKRQERELEAVARRVTLKGTKRPSLARKLWLAVSRRVR